MLNKRFDIQLLPVLWSHVTYGKVSESLPFVPLIFPLLSPSCTSQEGGAGGGRGGEGGGKALAHRSQCWVSLWLGDETQARRSPVQEPIGLCNYGGLIDTLFTDVEGVAQ
jgi:hypothetical protein